ncbi:MAG: sigma-54 specific flagellar transcriptional regulator A, partial [Paraglaciecola sp.]
AKYKHLDIPPYEPDYPQDLLERDVINEMFGAGAEQDEQDVDYSAQEESISKALPEEGLNLKAYISDLEVSLITQALEQQEWVVARAANTLGMRRTTLVEKMRKYDISKTELSAK